MPSMPFYYLLSTAILSSLLLLSSAQQPTSPPAASQLPSITCKSTPYPKLCRSILSAFKSSPSDPYHYGKFTVKQCLKQARKLSIIINHYLAGKRAAALSPMEALAMQDCGQLAELNVDYLEKISMELKGAKDMTGELADRVTSLLSGVVTNQQTCYDGLVEAKSGFAGALAEPLGNMTRLYSVSLALVSHALDRKLEKSNHGFLSKPSAVREPLDTLIRALRKSSGRGNTVERTLSELQGNGILINNTVNVSPNGTDTFTNISDAIAIAPRNLKPDNGYFVVYVRQGYYEEYVVVPKNKNNILLIGDGINKTIITGSHNRADNWTTYNSSTFAVSGERFVAVDITFRNTAGPEKHQAVAVRNSADFSTFYRCSFEGYQDTLYVHSLRQFYRDCDIYGTVDFIFGNAAAVFQNCNLYARKPLPDQKNAFTAQGRTDPNQNTGISIQNCRIEAAPDLAVNLSSTPSYLGRPWKAYSRTVVMQSYIGEVIHPAGWLEWNGTQGLDTLYYGEFANYGPGAYTSKRVQWPGFSLMDATQAVNFTVLNFTMGDTWLPDTDIPFSGGLF
ncbi:hypothetical protein SLEP1_g47425 [Rubroshorea leprosula]|uniref:Pectinesterase n=1 Tax=Rubroshorea leprosula TaxID=152421 RepID=A0AAV5LSB6_9ROSI|nr:hypothetical protein SLEP1_g47425 [Rubroshorea leprosula]